MKDILYEIKGFFFKEWTVEEKILTLLCVGLLGVIWGFIFSPIKKGISCGNNNGNTYIDKEED